MQKNPSRHAKEPHEQTYSSLLSGMEKVGRKEHYRRRKRALQNSQKKPRRHAKEPHERRNRALKDTQKHPTNTPAPCRLQQSKNRPKRALQKTEKNPTKDPKELDQRSKRALEKEI